MEEVPGGLELSGGMGAKEPASPQDPPSPPLPPSPPPPPSPPSPAAPERPGLSPSEQPSEAHARQLLLAEWRPPGGSLQLPPGVTWTLLFLRRPLYRNLLRSPNPEGAAPGGARAPGEAFPDRLSLLSVCFLVSLSLFLSLCHLCLSLSLRLSVSFYIMCPCHPSSLLPSCSLPPFLPPPVF